MKKLRLIAALGIIALAMACDTGGGNDPVPVDGVTLNAATLVLTVDGGPQTLTATVSPADATNKAVAWESDDEDVATVSATGVVTPVGIGTAIITVTTADGGFTDECTVTVTTPVEVTGVTLDVVMLDLTVGGGAQTLTATVAPPNATNKDVTWESDDTDVATVSPTGVVTPVGAGMATITVTTDDGGFTDDCIVTVTDPNAPGISLSATLLIFNVDDSDTQTLTATVTPAGANQAVTWQTGDSSVATVAGGVVTPVGIGTTTITATTADGTLSAGCTVSVTLLSLVRIPPEGSAPFTFMMGSPPGDYVSVMEGQFEATLSRAFYMSQYEVRVGEYREVGLVPDSSSYFPANNPAHTDLPIGMVTWFDALRFCNRLSEFEGLEPVYTITGLTMGDGGSIVNAVVTADFSKNGYRLPTEAQWEFSARAGTTTPWYWGNEFDDDYAYFWPESGSQAPWPTWPIEVGSRLPNAWGLYDMSGNSYEWVWDDLGWYPGVPTTDWVRHPATPVTEITPYAIVRGGGADSNGLNPTERARYGRSFSRIDAWDYRRNERYLTFGFRVIRPE